MSERNQNQSVSQAVQELRAQVATWEALLAGWPRVISETLADILEQSEAQAAERSQSEARERAQERQTWQHEMQSLLRRLSDAGGRQETLSEELRALSRRREHQHAPWWLGWSRDRWQVVVVSAVVSVVMTLGAMTLYLEFGPQARERARLKQENTTYQALWAAATEAERAGMRKRAWPEAAQQK